jgi:hypothetical protein
VPEDAVVALATGGALRYGFIIARRVAKACKEFASPVRIFFANASGDC